MWGPHRSVAALLGTLCRSVHRTQTYRQTPAYKFIGWARGLGDAKLCPICDRCPPPALYAPLKLTHSSRGRYKSRPCRREFPRGYKSFLQNFGNPYRSLKIQLTRIFFFLPHDLSFKILPKSNACVKKELIVLHKT